MSSAIDAAQEEFLSTLSHALLSALSADNNLRKQAEAALNHLFDTQREAYLYGLIVLLSKTQHISVSLYAFCSTFRCICC